MKNVKFDAQGSEPQWEIEVEFKNDLEEDIVSDLLSDYYDEIIEFEDEDIWFTIGDEEVRITSFWSGDGGYYGGLNEWEEVETETEGDGLRALANIAEEQGKSPEELAGVGPNYAKMIREASGMPKLEIVN